MSGSATRNRRVQPTSREDILLAAHTVFAERGYQGASMRRIAESAGLKTPSHLYIYFQDKDDLYRQMVDEAVSGVREVVVEETSLAREPVDAIGSICRAYLRIFDDAGHRLTFRIEAAGAMARPGALDEAVRASGTPTLDLFQRYLTVQNDQGRLTVPDARSTAIWLLWQLISFVELREFYPSVFADLPALDDYVDDLAHNVVYGLAPRDAGTQEREK